MFEVEREEMEGTAHAYHGFYMQSLSTRQGTTAERSVYIQLHRKAF
jgi:hypothetical protein